MAQDTVEFTMLKVFGHVSQTTSECGQNSNASSVVEFTAVLRADYLGPDQLRQILIPALKRISILQNVYIKMDIVTGSRKLS